MDQQFLHDMLIMGCGLVIVLPLAAYASRERAKRLLLPLAGLFDNGMGELTGTFTWTLRGRFKRRPVTILSSSGGQYSPWSIDLAVICSADMHFTVTRSGLGDPVLRSLRLLRTLQVGDDYLDHEYRFRTDEPERFAPWVKRMDVRRHIEALLDDRDIQYVSCHGGELRCRHSPRRRQFVMPTMADVRLILEALVVLADSLESRHQEQWVSNASTT